MSIENLSVKNSNSKDINLKKDAKLHFITVTSNSVYVPQESSPENRQYFFAYKIHIKNSSKITAQLMSRHWIVTDALGHQEKVSGPGVVGLQPKIPPGQSFEYESACPLSTSSGSMKGQFSFLSENGEPFNVEIPEFFLIAPNALH